MDYEKKYKEALSKAKSFELPEYKNIMASIFPELAESEDERIRKALVDALNKNLGNGIEKYGTTLNAALTWLEKQGEHQQLYIRFGDIPSNEKSKIYRGEKEIGTENGVSVYPAFKSTNGDIVLGLNLPITKTTLHTQQHLLEYDNRPCYLVTGDYVGKDTDGQILISNVNIIEKIDNYRAKTEIQGDTTSDTKYEVGADDSLSVDGKPFDYEKATITQKDYAPRDYNEIDPNLGIPDWVLMSRKKPVDKVEPFDKYEGLTDFERTLADICIGWIGEELGWKQYIKDNADVLLKIAIKMFNSIQDAPFEQKPAWSEEDEIEIPFGAKDSELQEETYYIPKGFHAEIEDDKVVIKKGEKTATWGDEDESCINNAIAACRSLYGEYSETAHWLKSLKDRVQGKEK